MQNKLANPVHIVVGDDGKRGNIMLRTLDPQKGSQVTTAVVAESNGWNQFTVTDQQESKWQATTWGESGGKEEPMEWTGPVA